jgi:hypothetical protein
VTYFAKNESFFCAIRKTIRKLSGGNSAACPGQQTNRRVSLITACPLQKRLPPRLIVDVPLNRGPEPFFETFSRFPFQFALGERGIDRITAVVPEPIGYDGASIANLWAADKGDVIKGFAESDITRGTDGFDIVARGSQIRDTGNIVPVRIGQIEFALEAISEPVNRFETDGNIV